MAGAGPSSAPYDQELQLERLFHGLSQGFQRLDKLPESKQHTLLKELTADMQEAKTLIREFEREARTDGMPANELNFRKKQYVQELNGFIGLKKAYSGAAAQRSELLEGAKSETEKLSTMNTTELMQLGRQQMKETDVSLLRSEKIVNDTMAIGIQTAETLQGQTRQLEKVIDDLDEIHFTMKKARQVIRDMTRSLMTDKLIMALILLVVLGIVAIIVLNILKAQGVSLPGSRRRQLLWEPEGDRLL
ncbi:hypothetical protein CHLNCDRAFT_55096 [Chlorella variabilis]|uniref:t-SNARE coiled-coil homology domain-containing protein n=1 Tax=Chlorella variabilis TaxID=554065 RepID=E1ZRS7_CHLVA|nr:hypothetical protein CHLNCDRAFT_55096 [Chlorella variabilis]EFN51513.1 hypothetical protein CHLNCDRAFT_55096 [Chlorella variabilis]|eukprot:XP_005843615.1 hypothetical protein CHLNCDRAFT_55096 [Chlorella variabilis]